MLKLDMVEGKDHRNEFQNVNLRSKVGKLLSFFCTCEKCIFQPDSMLFWILAFACTMVLSN